MKDQNMESIHSGTVLSLKTEECSDMFCNMDDPGRHMLTETRQTQNDNIVWLHLS